MNEYDLETATAYAQVRRADPHIVNLLACALGNLSAAQCLDIGCGTGRYTRALAAKGGIWHGVDPSVDMLRAIGQETPIHNGLNNPPQFYSGRAEALPFADKRFDAVISILATHHFSDISTAFREAARVLKPGAALAVFSACQEQAAGFWMADYFPLMMARDAADLPSLDQMQKALSAAGFADLVVSPFHVTAQTQDRFFYRGAAQPEIYLSAQNRAAMSVFGHADADELADGLARLAADIESRAWHAKYAQQQTPLGHYSIFVGHI